MEKTNNNKDAPTKPKLDSRAWIIFFSLILDLVGFTIILPLMPKLVDHYRSNGSTSVDALQRFVLHLQELLNVPSNFSSVLFGGILGSLFSLLQFISSPIAGSVSDYYGRKPVLLISMIGIAASYAVWAVADSFAIFLLARVIGGTSKANVSLATAIMADVTCSTTRAKAMALVGVAFSIGFIVGPVTGAAFSMWGSPSVVGERWWIYPALLALVLAILNVFFIYFAFEETLPQERRAKSLNRGFSEAWDLVNPVSLFSYKPAKGIPKKDLEKLQVLGLVYFLFLFLYSGLEYTLTFLTHLSFGYDAKQQGRMLLYSGLLMAFFQGFLARRIKQGQEKKIALCGLAVVIPAFVLVGIATSTTLLYAGLTLYSLGTAIVFPCITSMTASYGRSDQKGVVMGTLRSLGALARALGPFVASCVFFVLGAGPCYLLGAAGLFIPLILLQRSQV